MGREDPDHGSTRIIGQRELVVSGVLFQWWAVGERPALVTVRTPLFGTVTEFTHGDVAVCAELLAKRLLAQHHARAASARQQSKPKAPAKPVLQKPGWFQADDIDFSATNF